MLDFTDKSLYTGHSLVWLSTILATVVGSTFLLWTNFLKKRRQILPGEEFSMDEQGIPLENKPGVYKSGMLKNSSEELLEQCFPEVKTLYDAFLRGLKVSKNGDCLGSRKDNISPYTFKTYGDVWTESGSLGSAFITRLGLKPVNDTNVGIYAKNCPEWCMSILACVEYSMVVVPLYDTLGADAVSYIVKQAEIEVIIVEDEEKIRKLLDAAHTMPSLKHLVAIKPNVITPELVEKAGTVDIQLHNFYDLVKDGQENRQEVVPPHPEDIYMICYTSGTTGNPKGVILTHKNIVSNSSAFIYMTNIFVPGLMTPENCVSISYLPLAHVFEQIVHWSILTSGGQIGYFRGDIKELINDTQILKPTIFPSVPRLLNRFYDGVQAKLSKSGFVSKTVFKLAYGRKLAEIKRRIFRNDSVWDQLVFNKIREQFGGKVKFTITGSAPISPQILEFVRVALGGYVMEGYGQTENSAMATATWPPDYIGGHTGGSAVCNLLKLGDVPDMGYFAAENKGEVMLKGPHITKGYYKDPEKTAELFDEDGFLHTGDIGQIQPNGTLKIIDRKKNILKLAQGEYVAPEKIENIYSQSGFVQQIYVDGDSLERCLVAIVVPEFMPLKIWYETKYGQEENIEKICEHPEAKELVLKDIQKIGKENKLNSIEQVQALFLEHDQFSIENGLLTPTLKSKRPQLRQKYKPIMEEIYKNLQ